jgi:hypothetical protein
MVFESQLTTAFMVGVTLMATGNTHTGNNSIMSSRLNVWGVTAAMGTGALQSNDPNTVRVYLEMFLNKFHMGPDSPVKIANAGQTKWIQGTVQGNPIDAIRGNGLGVNQLYYPNVIIEDLTIGMGMLQAVSTTTVPQLKIQDFMVSLKMNGQSDDVVGVAPEWQYQNLLQEMGKGLFVQCRDGPQNPQAFGAEIGTMFEVLGLVGVEYEFEGQFFQRRWRPDW